MRKKFSKVRKKEFEHIGNEKREDWEKQNLPINLIDDYVNVNKEYKIARKKIEKLIKQYLDTKWELRTYLKNNICLKKYMQVVANNFLELIVMKEIKIKEKLVKKYDRKYANLYNKIKQNKIKIWNLSSKIEIIYNDIFKIVEKNKIKHII